MSLEDAALARKARLEALRAKKRKADGDVVEADGADGAANGTAKPTEALIAHRAYDRSTGQSRRHVKGETDTVESAVEGLAAQIVAADAEKRAKELDLFNIQPKKPNWDLKRDIDKKLEKLRPVEQAVIAELIRARMKGNQDGAATLAATAAPLLGEPPDQDISDDDDDDER